MALQSHMFDPIVERFEKKVCPKRVALGSFSLPMF